MREFSEYIGHNAFTEAKNGSVFIITSNNSVYFCADGKRRAKFPLNVRLSRFVVANDTRVLVKMKEL